MDRNLYLSSFALVLVVALRKESVDRNRKINTRRSEKMKSLSARRAWIEILKIGLMLALSLVALRKESVDRNFAVGR